MPSVSIWFFGLLVELSAALCIISILEFTLRVGACSSSTMFAVIVPLAKASAISFFSLKLSLNLFYGEVLW